MASWCAAPHGRRPGWPPAMRSRCSPRCREAEVEDPFVLGGEKLGSRLIMGTGGAPSLEVLGRALDASGTELTTVAMRRVDPAASGSVLDVLATRGMRVLPNTAGCFTAAEAVH